jgi:DNA-binding FadR family transcriptional regulator
MGFNKINNISLTDQFVQQIESMILSGELQVGEQLPGARDLCERMGVSRPVISAGLIELEKLGFVEIKPRSGAYVTDYRRKGTIETLGAIVRYNGGVMRDHESQALMQVRYALEQLCVELVIQNATDQQLADFKPYLEAIKTAKTREKCAEAVFIFHQELAMLSGNLLLPMLYHSCKEESIYLWHWFVKFRGRQEMYDIKKELYEALVRRDVKTATQVPKEYPQDRWYG